MVALTGMPGSPVPATIGMTWIRDGPGGIPASDKEMPQRFHRRDAGPGQGCHVSHLPDTTRLFARMLFMEVTVRLQARALCVAPLWNRKPVTVSRVSPSAKYWGWVQGYGSLNGGRSPAWTNARLTSSMTSISAKAIIRNVPPRSLLRSA